MEQRSTSSLYGTFFSLLLVLVFSSFLIFVSVRTYILFGSYTGLTDHFNTIGVIFLIFWILVISLLLRLIRRKQVHAGVRVKAKELGENYVVFQNKASGLSVLGGPSCRFLGFHELWPDLRFCRTLLCA